MTPLQLPERIESTRLNLRRLRYEDAEQIFYAYASKPEATKYLAWATHRSIEDTRGFLDYAIDSWNKGKDYTYAIICKENKQLIGSFGLVHEEGKMQFGYVLSPTQWGRGYATEACKAVLDVLKTKDELYRISTFVDVDNVLSIKVLEKCGLVKEARLTKWLRFINQDNIPKDCLLYHLPMKKTTAV